MLTRNIAGVCFGLLLGCGSDAVYSVGRMHVYGEAPPRTVFVRWLSQVARVTESTQLPWSLTLEAEPWPCSRGGGMCAGESDVAAEDLRATPAALAHELYHYQLWHRRGDADTGHRRTGWVAVDRLSLVARADGLAQSLP